MKYISLFSGIGGFEVAIHRVFPEAQCLGYSEVKKTAIKVYDEHFPDHHNLGDITQITDKEIQELVKNGCDLIVGGFPCTNLTALSRLSHHVTSNGLLGEKSSLFYEMLRVVSIVRSFCPKCNFIFENNATMRIKERISISKSIEEKCGPIYMTMLDNSSFGVQIRKRLFWTNFQVDEPDKNDCIQTWDDVLDPVDDTIIYRCSDHILDGYMNGLINGSNYGGKILISISTLRARKFKILKDNYRNKSSRIQSSFVSDNCDISERPYPWGKSRPILASSLPANIVLDRRECKGGEFIPRYYTPNEIHRLMGFETNWVAGGMNTVIDLLGNAVCVKVIEHLVAHL